MRARRSVLALSSLSTILAVPGESVTAATITDNFIGASSSMSWILPNMTSPTKPNSACMTAGNNTGSVPSCQLTSPDPVGNGALRLTSASTQQYGGIVSSTPFDASQGLEVTFTTYTYGGDNGGQYNFGNGGQARIGADGIAFYLIDADIAAKASKVINPGTGYIDAANSKGAANNVGATMGAPGGSLGYSCSNANTFPNGVIGGYIGLGIDEYGNFLNPADNTGSGPGGTANRIGLRGRGSISWPYLNANYPIFYPNGTSLDNQRLAVQSTCLNGYVMSGWNWGTRTATPLDNYTMLKDSSGKGAYLPLPSDKPIANGSAKTRSAATPITYKLKITSVGKLSLNYSYNNGVYQPIMTNQDITAANGNLPAKLLFGFTASTGGSTNIHEITCFKASPTTLSSDSAALSLPTGQFKTGAQIYIAAYNPNNWAGQMTANDLLYDTTSGAVTLATSPNWDAACGLTGGTCAATGATGITALAPSSRKILSWNGTQGVSFTWPATVSTSTLTAAQKTALSDDSSNTNGEYRLNYLRGDRNEEQSSSGIFRTRASVLGDIINSSPTWVGPPMAPYPSSSLALSTTWKDNLFPNQTLAENATGATTYGTFQTNSGVRQNVVYVGSNDGFLHGFRTGFYNAASNYVGNDTTKPNDGAETIAYIPAAVVKTIHSNSEAGLDFSSPNYGHNYSIDATAGNGDVFYGNNWHTWLVGGLGYGGQAIYALDVTDPSSSNFIEGNASNLVKGEWAYSSDTSSIWNNLGKTFGTPQIRRFHNGKWGAVFGNGYCFKTTNSPAASNDSTCQNSNTGHAGLYVMLLDADGTPSFKFLDTGNGTTTKPNGLSYVTPVDLDDDHITDYVYAGDLLGNIWRFDLSSDNPLNWAVSSTTPLFTAPANQPITTQLMVSASKAPTDTNPRIILNFGTGIQVPQTLSDADTYSAATQSMYGIWDWNMGDWNNKSSTKYAFLASTAGPSGALNNTSLAKQTFTPNGSTRTIGSNSICWKDSATINNCTLFRYGWYADLSSSTVNSTTVYEQIIHTPIISAGAFIFNTTIPAANTPTSCTTTSASGWTFALDPSTGSGLSGFFSGNSTDTAGYALALNATGSPAVVNVKGQPVLITKNAPGANSPGTATKLYPKTQGNRINWIQLR